MIGHCGVTLSVGGDRGDEKHQLVQKQRKSAVDVPANVKADRFTEAVTDASTRAALKHSLLCIYQLQQTIVIICNMQL